MYIFAEILGFILIVNISYDCNINSFLRIIESSKIGYNLYIYQTISGIMSL